MKIAKTSVRMQRSHEIAQNRKANTSTSKGSRLDAKLKNTCDTKHRTNFKSPNVIACNDRADRNAPETEAHSPVSRDQSPKPIDHRRWLIIISALLIISYLFQIGYLLQVSAQQVSSFNEYQLAGKAGDQVKLPCLIGRQLFCGEPYFIAWYKFNASVKNWNRIEHKSEDELAAVKSDAIEPSSSAQAAFNERVKFTWQRNGQSLSTHNGARQQHPSACARLQQQSTGGQLRNNFAKLESNFDCAQLTIGSLELADEGQYKCEITFAESLDYDKCPPSTLSQLNVIAQPNEPELLVNGRPVKGSTATATTNQLTFKEGAQVKLECQSSGGKPAPRIEWLNVSSSGQSNFLGGIGNSAKDSIGETLTTNGDFVSEQWPPEVQLMRSHWPQKRLTYLEPSSGSGGGPTSGQLITSSTVTISVSRFDLHSRFVCLLIPQLQPTSSTQDLPVKNLAQLGTILNQHRATGSGPPMLKWVKLDVQVKPTSVSLIVKDIESNIMLQPVQWQPPHQPQSMVAPNFRSSSDLSPTSLESSQPYFSLQPNRLYAIQCLVEGSRPQAQVGWFNRTAPIDMEQVQLNHSDYLLPSELSPTASDSRLSSFSRSIEQPNGTFRTIASLLLNTKIWDNFEELFCRVTNEAFQFDELIQVAPIISARLFVNFAPQASLDGGDQVQWTPGSNFGRLRVDSNGQFVLRCTVAANPLNQNTILQIEWLKDGRKLSSSAANSTSERVQIDKANHLHLPQAGINAPPAHLDPFLLLAASGGGANNNNNNWKSSQPLNSPMHLADSKLLATSSLSVSSAIKADSGAYSCQYKLTPAPSASSGGSAPMSYQSQQQMRITSGQANQTIQVNAIEVKSPTLRISSSSGLIVYGLRSPSDGKRSRLVVVAEENSIISLKCDLNYIQPKSAPLTPNLGHKLTWHLNGAHLFSSSTTDVYNISLDRQAIIERERQLTGVFTCSHQALEMPTTSNGSGPGSNLFHGSLMRVQHSDNEIDLRIQVEPELLKQRKDLMPPVRSFSELELTANSASKLKLVCMAKCEPICSIDWFIQRKSPDPSKHSPLIKLTSNEPDTTPNPGAASLRGSFITGASELDIADKVAKVGNKYVLWTYERSKQQPNRYELAGLASTLSSLATLENVVHRSSSAPQNEPKPTWTRETSLAPAWSAALAGADLMSSSSVPLAGGSNGQVAELASRQLMRDAELHLEGTDGANVFSKLELSYYQIGQLLLGDPVLFPDAGGRQLTSTSDEILVKCKLNKTFKGQPFASRINGSASSDRANKVSENIYSAESSAPSNLGYAVVSPSRLFPVRISGSADETSPENLFAISPNEPETNSASRMNINEGTSGSDQRDQFVLANEPPLNLTDPFGPPKRDHQQRENRAFMANDWQHLDVHSKRLLALGGGASSQPDDELPADEMQIRILLDERFKAMTSQSNLLEKSSGTNPVLSMISPFADPKVHLMKTPSNLLANSSSSNSNFDQPIISLNRQGPGSYLRDFFSHLDWLIIGVCSLVLIWLLFLVSSTMYRRRKFRNPLNCLRAKSQDKTSWRFQTTRTTSSDDVGVVPIVIDSGPFHSKVCLNYYGDSERDTGQSCSQSSHYEEFVQNIQQHHPQQQQQMYQQRVLPAQPTYFNGNHTSTMNTRRHPMQQSLLYSSTGGSSSTASRHNGLGHLRDQQLNPPNHYQHLTNTNSHQQQFSRFDNDLNSTRLR